MLHLQIALILSLLTSTFAFPTSAPAAGLAKRSTLSPQRYPQFQVSNGIGGNALAEVKAKFPIDEANLANIDPVDLEIIKAAGEITERAETGAGGFNEAIAARAVGKIKNKVLKLQLPVLRLGAEVAKGRQDRATKLQEQRTKLEKNVQLDREAAGQRSHSVDFEGSSQPRR